MADRGCVLAFGCRPEGRGNTERGQRQAAHRAEGAKISHRKAEAYARRKLDLDNGSRHRQRNGPLYFYDERQIRSIGREAGFDTVEVIKIEGAGSDYHVCLTP